MSLRRSRRNAPNAQGDQFLVSGQHEVARQLQAAQDLGDLVERAAAPAEQEEAQHVAPRQVAAKPKRKAPASFEGAAGVASASGVGGAGGAKKKARKKKGATENETYNALLLLRLKDEKQGEKKGEKKGAKTGAKTGDKKGMVGMNVDVDKDVDKAKKRAVEDAQVSICVQLSLVRHLLADVICWQMLANSHILLRSVLQTMNCVLEMMNCVLQMMNSVLQMMNSALRMMNCVLQMMNSVLQTTYAGRCWLTHIFCCDL